jgi:hypothetical protein
MRGKDIIKHVEQDLTELLIDYSMDEITDYEIIQILDEVGKEGMFLRAFIYEYFFKVANSIDLIPNSPILLTNLLNLKHFFHFVDHGVRRETFTKLKLCNTLNAYNKLVEEMEELPIYKTMNRDKVIDIMKQELEQQKK